MVDYEKGSRMYCPNCAAELDSGAEKCPACRAVFGPGSGWKPIVGKPIPPDRTDPFFGVLGVVFPLVGWCAMQLYNHFRHGPENLGTALLVILAVAAGFVFGGIATGIAIYRGERWKVLQFVGGIVNFGTLAVFAPALFR